MTAPDGLHRGPLHDRHVGLGARITGYAGWAMPLRYAGELGEHRAVRGAAGLFDLSHMGEIEVRGSEAGTALDFALVGALSSLTVGRARYTLLCDPAGGVLDDLIVYRLGGDRFLVVANAANTGVVHAALRDRATGYDAEVLDVSGGCALIAVQGPRTVDVLAGLVPVDLPAVPYYSAAETELAGVPVLLARTGYTGEDGVELFVAPDAAADVWDMLLAAGQSAELQPCGLSARDTLRLEAGMPLYGHELTSGLTPYDAGLGRSVRLDKPGDFVGRAALAERASAAAERRLAGLIAHGRRAPRAGDLLYPPGGGTAIGAVTSGSPSPTLGRPIAMAYLPPDVAIGTTLEVGVRGARERADVVPLPFYRRPR